jgi:hypothetical protein
MPGHLTKAIVSQWATDAYLAGFQAAMDASGTGLPPTDIDVSIFDPRKNGDVSQPTKRNNKVNAEERSNLEYDPCKCDARVWNHGYGAQCNRKKIDDEILCVSCLKKYADLDSKGLDLAFGLITGERPLVSLDKEVGDDLVWQDMKKEKSSTPKKRNSKMPSVGDMREYLDSRGTSHDGCKKPEVFELYQEQKALEALESSQETNDSSNDSSNEVIENPLNVAPLDVSSDTQEEETQVDEKPKKKKKSKKKKGTQPSEAELRADLSAMKVKALKKRAKEVGVDEEKLEDADDEEDVKGTIIELVVAAEQGKKKKPADKDHHEISADEAKEKIEVAKAAAEKVAAEKAAADKAAVEKADAEKAAAEKAAAEKAAAEEAAAEKAAAEEEDAEEEDTEEEDAESESDDSGDETDDMSDNEDNSDDSGDEEELEADETESVTYEDVDYFLEVSTNKVIDPKGNHVGSWSQELRSIAWNTDADREAHEKLVE